MKQQGSSPLLKLDGILVHHRWRKIKWKSLFRGNNTVARVRNSTINVNVQTEGMGTVVQSRIKLTLDISLQMAFRALRNPHLFSTSCCAVSLDKELYSTL